MKQHLISATANRGIGLWTFICIGFSNIFGVQCKNLKKKQDWVLLKAKNEFVKKVNLLGADYIIQDYRVVWNKTLSVTVSGLASKAYLNDKFNHDHPQNNQITNGERLEVEAYKETASDLNYDEDDVVGKFKKYQ